MHHLPSRKGVYSKKYKLGDCVLNKFIKKKKRKKKKHFSTEAEQTPITCFSLCNIEYNLNRLFFSSLKGVKESSQQTANFNTKVTKNSQ